MNNPSLKLPAILMLMLLLCCFPVTCLAADYRDNIAVTVVPVKYERRSQPIKNSGRVSNKVESRLSFKTSGLIQHIGVEEGDTVRAGQILATLDLEEIDARQKRAASNHEKAAMDLVRFSRLFDNLLVSLQVKQDAQTANDNTAAELQIANFNRKLSVIRAPAEGHILKRYVESDELIQSGQPVFLIAASRQGSVVRIGLIDKDIVKVAVGDSAKIVMDAYPDIQFSGSVSEVALGTDSGVGTFEVEVMIDAQGLSLRSGLIARVEIMPASQELQYYVPIEAINRVDNGVATLFVINKKSATVKAVSVEVLDFLQDEVVVRGTLSSTDKVIKSGASYLRHGSAVTIVDET